MDEQARQELKIDSVAVFFDADLLKAALQELKDTGVEDRQIGILCTEDALRAKLAGIFRLRDGKPDGKESPNIEFLDEEAVGVTAYAGLGGLGFVAGAVGGGALIASAGVLGGALAVATTASAVVGGLGALAAELMSKSDAEALQEQLDAGHILLFVRTGEDRQKAAVVDVLTRHSGLKPRTLKPETVPA